MKPIAGSAFPFLAALTLAVLAACGQPELVDTAPPRSDISEAPYARPAPAPSSTETPLLGAPTQARQSEPIGPLTMAPIPNPPERARPRAAWPKRTAQAPAAKAVQSKAAAPSVPVKPAAAKPTQKPAAVVATAPAPASKPAPVVAAPKAVAPALKPEQKSPTVLPPAADSVRATKAPPSASPGSPPVKLGQALAADISAGARLAIPDGLPNGYQGIVVLTLPENFATRLRDEAKRLGLGEDAKVTDIRAVLTGQGYDIKPDASQVARLGDEPVKFAWLVAEGSDRAIEKTPLRAEISGELHGGRVARSFPLASIGAVPAPLTQATEKAAAPQISAKGLAFALPLLLILVALFILGRWAKARRDEKARRRAALEQFHT